ncbi:hypothetical protein KXV85_003559, partial [Aspergillus fumigatus]
GERGFARPHQQSPRSECNGAARGDRRLRRGRRALHAPHHVAESACRPPRALGVLQRGARAQAAGDRPRRRRRIRLEDLHLSRRDGGAVGVEEDRSPGEMDLRPHRSVPHRRAWPRPRLPCRDGVRQGQQDPRAAGKDPRQFRRLHVAVLLGGADLSLRDAAVGPVRHPGDLCRGDRGLHQHHS